MGLLSKEQLRQLIKERDMKTATDVHEMIKDLFGEVLQEILEAELDNSLGYEKNDRENKKTSNSRNGYTKKKVTGHLGDMTISVPRDRHGEFEPVVVPKHSRDVSAIEGQILSMYAKGMSTRDIQSHLHEIYGIDASPTLISQITDRVHPLIQEWQNRPLQQTYAFLFMDAIHYKVRQDGQVVSKAAYVVIGVDLDGHKDVLGIWIGENESARFWLSVLTDLKNRGVEDILITSVDNLTGFSQAIAASFPKTQIQKCIVHQIRNSTKYVANKDLKEFTADLKAIYKAVNEDEALKGLDDLEAKWGRKYPLSIRTWRQNWPELATFFQYPSEIRKVIYTTNMIESFHRQLRKVTKGKAVFPNDDALSKMLYLVTMDVVKKWTAKIQNWPIILSQLSIYFEGRV